MDGTAHGGTHHEAVGSEIRRTLRILHDPGALIELRIPSAVRAGTISGYFDDVDALVQAASRLDGRAAGIYITAHRIQPELLCRAANRVVERAKQTTSDSEVERYRWLLVDLDPKRAAGISSTDTEHEAALQLAEEMAAWLIEQLGCSAESIVRADSGNGAHVLVRIDEPADKDTATLIKRCLDALHLRWSTDAVHVDTSVGNPARIWRLYGTLTAKGDATPERPHRRSRIVSGHETSTVTDRKILELLASMAPVSPERHLQAVGPREKRDVAAWLTEHGIEIAREGPWKDGGRKWVLAECPFASDDHGRDQAAYVVQHGSGAIAAGCHHARCNWKWATLRARYEEEPAEGGSDTESTDDAPESGRGGGRESQATILVKLAHESGAEFFNDGDEVFAACPIGEARATYRIKSKQLRQWLLRLYYQRTGNAPGNDGVQSALALLESQGRFDGEHRRVFTRLGEQDGRIYLDLCDDDWRVVEISALGWTVTNRPPVSFVRPHGMLPLPEPARGGRVDELRNFVNVRCDDNWRLLQAWLVAALRPIGPYPALGVHGEQGSAKSTMSRMIRSLVDPNRAALRAEPRNAHDVAIAAKNGWIIALDNLSSIPVWLSDVLCRLATGGGFATRELYSDADEVLFDAQRPVILNGITEVATRPDLLDRCILLELPVIAEDRRRSESKLLAAFERARPRILGAILDAVAVALRDVGRVQVDRLPRMADFAIWAAAAAPALGTDAESFFRAYKANGVSANQVALESSELSPYFVQLGSETKPWTGTATDLLRQVNELAGDKAARKTGWPGSPRGMAGALRRLAPNLRIAGIDVEFPARSDKRGIVITRNMAQLTVGTVDTVEERENAQHPPDGTTPDTDGGAGPTVGERALQALGSDGLDGADGSKQALSVDVERIEL